MKSDASNRHRIGPLVQFTYPKTFHSKIDWHLGTSEVLPHPAGIWRQISGVLIVAQLEHLQSSSNMSITVNGRLAEKKWMNGATEHKSAPHFDLGAFHSTCGIKMLWYPFINVTTIQFDNKDSKPKKTLYELSSHMLKHRLLLSSTDMDTRYN